MTTNSPPRDGAVLRRARSQLVTLRSQRTPIALPSLMASASFIGIVCACCSEFFSAGIGFHAAFPDKSDGTGLASELLKLRYPIIFCLLAGDTILQAVPGRAKRLLDGLTHGIGIWAILLLLFGVGAFMFCATFLTLGDGVDQGFAGHFVALALGVASASMFTLSFLGSHAMISQLFGAIPSIVAGLSQRAHIKRCDALITQTCERAIEAEGLRTDIDELEKPDALKRGAADEAGMIVGEYIAEAHDLVASRKVLGDRSVEPQDRCEVPQVPVAALEQRYADLKQYTAAYFFNLLNKKEA